ncbi:MAG: PhnE/PtxC family ABC transporter permease [Planctomycetota bacterium]|jgi:phosphonate transport system permease protein
MKSAEQLRRERPRSRAVRISVAAMLGLVVFAWSSDAFDFAALRSERSQRNLDRFLTEVRPYPLQNREWDWDIAAGWFREQTAGRAGSAMADTLAFSIAAIVLAGLLAIVASVLAARNLSTAEPFLPASRPPTRLRRTLWNAVVWATRLGLILVRAIPEYVWAFILLMLLGPGAWPGVLALALHNSGILGKLFAEVVENSDPRPPRALRALGASRLEIAATAIWPASLNRLLLFFFYRWETCVREATVLGLLGFSGLGYYILQAQAAIRWDEMVLWTLLGSVLILAGDLVSALARSVIRSAAS